MKLDIANPNAAGIDVGSAGHFVAVPPDRDDEAVRKFTSFTEDLGRLVERAAKLKDHLGNHHADRKNVRSLELLEAKIHRLSNYYKENEKIPQSWRYATAVAQLS